MLKAKIGNVAIIGLSVENIVRLKRGKPIKFNLSEIGLGSQEIFIVYGATEEIIAQDLLKAAGD